MQRITNVDEVEKMIKGDHHDVFSVLGMHKRKEGMVVRAFLPYTKAVSVIDFHHRHKTYAMAKGHPDGFYEILLRDREDFFEYQLDITDDSNNRWVGHDPYSFLPVLSHYDLYLFNRGDHRRIYEKLGAHRMTVNGVTGIYFAVWAPCARNVSVIGDFNRWDGRINPMRKLGASGVWEIFMPRPNEGALYKFEIKTQSGEILRKADPYGFYAELRSDTASIVYNLEGYRWQDQEWLEERKRGNYLERAVAIYEVHMGSWM